VSRVSVRWGIPVPDDPEHTIYVWFEALTNYLTAVGYGNEAQGGESQLARYWPADLHLVGKDILRFHAVYWPAFLMATGIPLPKTVYAHGLWISGGRKMSKSLGNVIDLDVLRRHFTPDAVRFFSLREMVFGQDGDFTYEALIDRVNGDLAAGLGNLSSRTLTMVRNYFAGTVPHHGGDPSVFASQIAEVRTTIESTLRDFDAEFEAYNFSRAIEAVWAAIGRVDKLISTAKPWDLAKDAERKNDLAQVIATAIEVLRHLTVVLAPVLPEATQSIWEQLGGKGSVASINPRDLEWGSTGGETIGEIKPVFPRLEKQRIMEEIKQEEAASQAARTIDTQPLASEATPGVAYICIEDFARVELRAGEILTAERIPKADKLLKMTIDLGEETPRQILAGIAQYYEAEKLVGRKVIVVANLAPRKMRGLESQGMILAASIGEEGRPILAGFIEDVPNGAKLR
jgi:methionyl-tRNA synthetase